MLAATLHHFRWSALCTYKVRISRHSKEKGKLQMPHERDSKSGSRTEVKQWSCTHTVRIEGVVGCWLYIKGIGVDGGPAGGPWVKNCRWSKHNTGSVYVVFTSQKLFCCLYMYSWYSTLLDRKSCTNKIIHPNILKPPSKKTHCLQNSVNTVHRINILL